MKVPRDVNASELIRLLERYGYTVTRQTGSHVRLCKKLEAGEHVLTIPDHRPIKIGTLQAIVKDLCSANKWNIVAFYAQL